MSVLREILRLLGLLISLSISLLYPTHQLYLAAFLLLLAGWLLSLLFRITGSARQANLAIFTTGLVGMALYLVAIIAYS